ncbi:hypothetical protein RRG08_025146 [Elysia crispata]|uniref:Uncharacterized protein n=1 Tax=Elysia crispata TaxID=231223 RepID=A0AAE0YB53_9GAST|nr:hypothetical protein RRG08_025146 [Elysia crispata]
MCRAVSYTRERLPGVKAVLSDATTFRVAWVWPDARLGDETRDAAPFMAHLGSGLKLDESEMVSILPKDLNYQSQPVSTNKRRVIPCMTLPCFATKEAALYSSDIECNAHRFNPHFRVGFVGLHKSSPCCLSVKPSHALPALSLFIHNVSKMDVRGAGMGQREARTTDGQKKKWRPRRIRWLQEIPRTAGVAVPYWTLSDVQDSPRRVQISSAHEWTSSELIRDRLCSNECSVHSDSQSYASKSSLPNSPWPLTHVTVRLVNSSCKMVQWSLTVEFCDTDIDEEFMEIGRAL